MPDMSKNIGIMILWDTGYNLLWAAIYLAHEPPITGYIMSTCDTSSKAVTFDRHLSGVQKIKI
jgi:hypothetical protein